MDAPWPTSGDHDRAIPPQTIVAARYELPAMPKRCATDRGDVNAVAGSIRLPELMRMFRRARHLT
jgi:hypothetical protein